MAKELLAMSAEAGLSLQRIQILIDNAPDEGMIGLETPTTD